MSTKALHIKLHQGKIFTTLNYYFEELLMKKLMAALLISFSLLFSGCASRTAGWSKADKKIELSEKELKSLKSEALAAWNERHEKVQLEKSLELFAKLANASVDNYEYLVYLTRGYYFLADAHYEDDANKKKYWEIGTSYGEKALATNEAFAKAMQAGEKVEDHLDKLGKREVAAMYWTAANLGKWARLSGIATTLKFKNRIRSLVATVEKIQPDYFYAAAFRYWGGYYAVAPGFAGGSMPKSKENFEKSIKMAPAYLGTKVLYAEIYMTKKEDKAGFQKQLNEVINAKLDKNDIYSENLIEKRKAMKLLEKMKELF
jgi:hypothetical protein